MIIICPRCGASPARRIRRRIWERLFFRLRPFFCDACEHRFYRKWRA